MLCLFPMIRFGRWRGQKFWLGEGGKMEKFCDVSLVTFFGDVIMMTSLKWRHNWFFWSSILSWLVWKNTIWPSHTTSDHQNQRKEGNFWKFVTKIMHFRHISAKIQPKIWNLFIISSYQCEATSIRGGPSPLSPLPSYVLGLRLGTHLFIKVPYLHQQTAKEPLRSSSQIPLLLTV